MNGVYQIGITVLGEWISDKLTLLNILLLTSSETTLSITKSQKSTQIIVFEIDRQEKLRLQVGWRFSNIGASKLWVLVVEHFNLILGELVAPHESIDVHWVPVDTASRRISYLGLRERGGIQSVLINESSSL